MRHKLRGVESEEVSKDLYTEKGPNKDIMNSAHSVLTSVPTPEFVWLLVVIFPVTAIFCKKIFP